VPDTFDGRFQVLTLCGVLALRRLTVAGGQADLIQTFTDALFLNFDDGLREAGVGDLSVAKHMKKIGQAFYGRYGVYDAALTAEDRPALAAALSRNIWGENPSPFAPALAEKAFQIATRLNSVPPAAMAAAEPWAAG
jgi:cytochrome b pre-mRNA-processing protein 3